MNGISRREAIFQAINKATELYIDAKFIVAMPSDEGYSAADNIKMLMNAADTSKVDDLYKELTKAGIEKALKMNK